MSNQFRIGGVYRDRHGSLCKIVGVGPRFMAVAMLDDDAVWKDSMRHHLDGRFHATEDDPDSVFHLLPGELVQVNGEWVSPTPTLDKMEAEKPSYSDEFSSVGGEPLGSQPTKSPLEQLREMVAVQGTDGTWNCDDYMVGMFNGMELALAVMEDREPQFRTLKPQQPDPQPVSTAKPALPALQRCADFDGAVMKVR